MRQSFNNLVPIKEQAIEDGHSNQSNTDIIKIDQGQDQGINFGNEKQAISNQLELASMASEVNSVMGSSPIRSNRVASRRTTKAKLGDK